MSNETTVLHECPRCRTITAAVITSFDHPEKQFGHETLHCTACDGYFDRHYNFEEPHFHVDYNIPPVIPEV